MQASEHSYSLFTSATHDPLNRPINPREFLLLNHEKQALAVGSIRPKIADFALLLGIVVREIGCALVFDHHDAPVVQQRDEIGIKLCPMMFVAKTNGAASTCCAPMP